MTPFLALYVFSLMVGGVFVGLAVFSGISKDFEIDKDADFDADADADFDADADADLDAEAEGGGMDKDFHNVSRTYRPLRSFKFWTFFLAFLGLTGTVATLLSLWSSQWGVFALSLLMGLFAGLSITSILHIAAQSQSARGLQREDYRGQEAKVVIPFGAQGMGKIRVRIKGEVVELEAVPFEHEEKVVFDFDDSCFILDIEDGVAQVMPASALNKEI